jgi:small subunit ribosomal protein S21
MSYVIVQYSDNRKHTESLDRALKELKRRLKKEGLFQELKRREYYMSPSAKRKFRKNESFKRRKREEKKQEWNDKNQSD